MGVGVGVGGSGVGVSAGVVPPPPLVGVGVGVGVEQSLPGYQASRSVPPPPPLFGQGVAVGVGVGVSAGAASCCRGRCRCRGRCWRGEEHKKWRLSGRPHCGQALNLVSNRVITLVTNCRDGVINLQSQLKRGLRNGEGAVHSRLYGVGGFPVHMPSQAGICAFCLLHIVVVLLYKIPTSPRLRSPLRLRIR